MTPEKEYQQRSLKTLGDFLRGCSKHGKVAQAFFEAQEANKILPSGYIPVVAAGLSTEMPYVCLRVPTGGGKTARSALSLRATMKGLMTSAMAVCR